MKYSFILVIVLVFSGKAVCQESHQQLIVGLKAKIAVAEEDSEKVDLLDLLARQYQTTDSFNELLTTAKTEYDLATKINYPYGIISSLWQYSCYYNLYKKDYHTASGYLKTAVDIIDKDKLDLDHRVELMIHFGILNHFFMVGDYTYAMKMVAKRVTLYEGIKDTFMVAHFNSLMGFIFLKQGRTADSKTYYQKYFDAGKEMNDSCVMADADNCLSDVFVQERKYDSALYYGFAALSAYNTILVHQHYLRLQLSFKSERTHFTRNKIGYIYKQMHNYPQALKYTLGAINNINSFNPYDLAAYYINAGDIYKELGKYNLALSYLDTGLTISKKIQHAENIRDAFNCLAQTYSFLKKYDSAYYYGLLYNKLKDSISNEKINAEIEQIHTNYEVEKKDHEIQLLNQKNKLKESTISRQILTRNITIAATIMLAILLFLMYNSHRLKQKNKFQAELNQQRNEMFNAVINTQEQERKRIAQDLHDGLGSVLSAAKLKLSELDNEETLTGNQKDKYFTAVTLLDEAAKELRNISHNIMPASLARLGLIAALQSVFGNISSHSGLHIAFSAYSMEKRLIPETEVSIYRIILELVNNVVKHASATEVIVQIIRHPDHISITIEDNGIGFNQKENNQQGIGINNIFSRVEFLKGTIDIESDNGTSVLITIPYME